MGLTTAGPRPARSACALGAGVLLALSALAGCGGGGTPQAAAEPRVSTSPSPTVTPDEPVEVIGPEDPASVTVGDPEPGIAPGDGLYYVSQVYPIEHEGELAQPALVRVVLDNAVPARTPVVAAARDGEDGPWRFVSGRLDTDRRHVEFITRELGSFGILAMDRASAAEQLADAFTEAADRPANPEDAVTKPECTTAAAARQDGYEARSWKRRTVFWCLGQLGDSRVLSVTNRRDVPVRVSAPGAGSLGVTGNATGDGTPWTAWTAAVGEGTGTLLLPGRTARFDADLDPGASLLLTARDDQAGRSVQVLRAATTAIATQLDAFGVASPRADRLFASVLAQRSCTRALGKDAEALVAGCLAEDALVDLLDTPGLVVAPLVEAPATRALLDSELTRLRDAAPKVEQRVQVSRSEPPFDALVGRYTGPTRVLTITEDGLATERLSSPAGPVIDLTYRLANPTRDGRTWTATSTLTAVKVLDRKLVSGALPRVGAPGMLTLAGGIVTPPYLATTYCTADAAEQGSCG
ncbi:hypothetical protein [Nocardioides scoriae]|uniref:hypothetical protein n=1 Tax=Nocardioides scoriae TaxID=642780 RepID=UPI0012FBCAFC|nr:hypothetical protein [Nocardioides scoriae]